MQDSAPNFEILDKHLGTKLVNEIGVFSVGGYRLVYNGRETNHLLLYVGLQQPTPVRVQSGCLTGDIFRDDRCDCNDQLIRSMQYISKAGNGVIVYTIEDDGRGRGTLAKLRVYNHKDNFGIGSKEACEMLELPYEARDYYPIAKILLDVGLERVILLGTNANKKESLEKHGIVVVGIENIFEEAENG